MMMRLEEVMGVQGRSWSQQNHALSGMRACYIGVPCVVMHLLHTVACLVLWAYCLTPVCSLQQLHAYDALRNNALCNTET